jgi:tetratricopeptide (TPR) repeat protein
MKIIKFNKIKNMNKICIYILCLAFVGCHKSPLLNKAPLGQVDVTNAYLTAGDAQLAVTAAYSWLAANNWCCTYVGPGYMYWVLGNVASDDTEKGGESGSDQFYAQQVQLFNIPADNDATRDAWQSQYNGIRLANAVLDHVGDIQMDATLKGQYLAEAKFLRAYFYFNLVKTFGDVPLVLSTTQDLSKMIRTPKSDVYAQIIKDLTDAISGLPLKYSSSADAGRTTMGAAESYLAKVYLYLENFPLAEQWFGTVINSGVYSLDPDYYHTFTPAGENSPEHIFQVQFVNDQGPHPTNNYMSQIMGSRARNGWGFNLPTQDFVDAFEPGDPRLAATVYQNGTIMPDGSVANVGNSTTGYMNKKLYVNDYDKINGGLLDGIDDLHMRLGKVYLWYAEAANENGNTAEALKYLNLIRLRARSGNAGVLADITETNKDALRKIIWHEERVEFGQEYERFFELVRQKRAGTVLRAYAAKYNTAKGASFKDGVNEIFPIPQTEINLSKDLLKQNPGY